MAKHPITGCRVDTIFDGVWLVDEKYLEQWINVGWAIVEKGELQAVSVCSREMAEQADEKPYAIKDGIAEITISGPITKYDTSMSSLFGGTSTVRLRDTLRQVRAEAKGGMVRGLFVHVDSGGGTFEGTPEAAEAIRRTGEVIPVHVHAEDKSCSGALYLGVSGDVFTCGPGTSVGSVGTMLKIFDPSGKNDGSSKPLIFRTGVYKGMTDQGVPLSQSQKDEIQRIVNSVNENFTGWVKQQRNLSDAQMSDITTARVYIGKQAVDIGLCDAICMTDDAMDMLKKKISDGVVGRGPTSKVQIQAAPTRSNAMPYTAAQLESIRKLPGAESVTAENAEVLLLNIATQQHAEIQTLKPFAKDNETLKAEVVALKAKVPQVMEAGLLAQHAELAEGKINLLQEKGLLLTTQADTLKAALKDEDGKPVHDIVMSPLLPVVYNVLGTNKPNGLLTDISKAQPAPKTEPGSGERQQEGSTFEQTNHVRVQAGLEPLTVEEWKKRRDL